MFCFEVMRGGEIHTGIVQHEGCIVLGNHPLRAYKGAPRKVMRVPVSDAGDTLEHAVLTPEGVSTADGPDIDSNALIVLHSQHGINGGWWLRLGVAKRGDNPQPETPTLPDDDGNPVWVDAGSGRVAIVARGSHDDGNRHPYGAGWVYLLAMTPGAIVTIVRGGKMRGAPSRLVLEWANGELAMTPDPETFTPRRQVCVPFVPKVRWAPETDAEKAAYALAVVPELPEEQLAASMAASAQLLCPWHQEGQDVVIGLETDNGRAANMQATDHWAANMQPYLTPELISADATRKMGCGPWLQYAVVKDFAAKTAPSADNYHPGANQRVARAIRDALQGHPWCVYKGLEKDRGLVQPLRALSAAEQAMQRIHDLRAGRRGRWYGRDLLEPEPAQIVEDLAREIAGVLEGCLRPQIRN